MDPTQWCNSVVMYDDVAMVRWHHLELVLLLIKLDGAYGTEVLRDVLLVDTIGQARHKDHIGFGLFERHGVRVVCHVVENVHRFVKLPCSAIRSVLIGRCQAVNG